MFCFERKARICTIHYLWAWEDTLKYDVCTDTFLPAFPWEYAVLRLCPQTPGSEILSQCQRRPSLPLRITFFKTSTACECGKEKKTQAPPSSLKKGCALPETLKSKAVFCSRLLQSKLQREEVTCPQPHGLPRINRIITVSPFGASRAILPRLQVLLQQREEEPHLGPNLDVSFPHPICFCSAEVILVTGALLPPFDPEDTFVLIFPPLHYRFSGFISYSHSKEREKHLMKQKYHCRI